MYHCHIHFYFTGRQCSAFEVIKKQLPPEHFSYEFSQSDIPEEKPAADADVILANLQGIHPESILHPLISYKKKGSELILLAQQGQIQSCENILSEVRDIWLIPMSDMEVKFRFLKWQEAFKTGKDFWQSEHFLEAVINSSPNLIWYKDKEGVHEKVNDSFCRMVNKSKEQVEGRRHAYIWDVEQDDPACIESECEAMLKKKTCVSEEFIQTREGTKQLTTYKSPLYDLDGNVMGTVGLGIDVTQERGYEKELLKKNQMLETLFTTTECGVMCHTIDGSQILSINQAALNILGYESQKNMMSDGFHMIAMSAVEEDKPKLLNAIKGLKNVGDNASVEYRVQHKNGKILYVICNIKLLEEDGNRFYQRFILDCTAQKMQEEQEWRKKNLEIEYQEKLFDIFSTYLASNTDDVYMLLNENMNTVEYISPNVERVLGVSKESVTKDLKNFGRPRYLTDQTASYEDLKKLKPGSESITMETERINQKTGEHKYFRENAYCVTIQNVNKLIVYISDRTKERQTQNALAEALEMAQVANKAKSAFLSSVSHDIRTPMNAIMGLTTLLRDESGNPEHVAEYTQKIYSASQHLLGLINDVLDMNKIESGNTTLNISEFNLAEIIDDLNTIIRPQAKAKNQTFEISTSSLTQEHLLGDKLRINQILINILSNAIKYTQEGGKIVMQVKELPQINEKYSQVQFTVSDNGQGMSEEYLKVIFNPFTREKVSTVNQIQGTGLGMAITKSLVDLMNGSIQVQSTQGEGSVFTVRLEFRIQDNHAGEDWAFWRNNGLKRMLVADDDEFICSDIIRAMSGTGVITQFATNGPMAVDMIRQARGDGKPFDLILLDWKMPGMSGLETARMIRNDHQDKIPILLFTAYDWEDIEEEALGIGINHFLLKPFFMSNFKEAVERIMGNREKSIPQTESSSVIKGRHILVVDDIEINRMILVKILDKLEAVCDIAENGQEAVEKFKNSKPGEYDIIFMDIQMPVMNGYDATKAIRSSSHPCAKQIAIIAMTANAFIDDVKDALESGMDAHIAKPVVVDQLKATVREVLQKKEG